MRFLKRNKLSKILQGQKGQNHKAFCILTHIGFSPRQARKMLIAGNDINVKRISLGAPVTAPTIYAAAYGKRHNPDGQAVLARALDIPVDDLFPENHSEASNG